MENCWVKNALYSDERSAVIFFCDVFSCFGVVWWECFCGVLFGVGLPGVWRPGLAGGSTRWCTAGEATF